MALKINNNYQKLKENYIFSIIDSKYKEYQKKHKQADIINLGVGDVKLTFTDNLIDSLTSGIIEQKNIDTFKGYPPETGYNFLKEKIKDYYKKRNVSIIEDEIFISNGAGCDVCNLLDLFGKNEVVIQNPTYPAYFNSSFLTGNKIKFIKATKQNNFCPSPKYLKDKSYLIYLCSPNNPTGATFNKSQLKEWVDFAIKTNSLIIFDCAYESFIEDESPHFIYEIENAKKCCIEIASFSKMSGFTNLRCGWTIVPKEIVIDSNSLNKMWNKHQNIYFNGVPYHIQKGAEYTLTEKGQKECKININYYKKNVFLLKECLVRNNFDCITNNNSPYIWLKCLKGYDSWNMFDFFLNKLNIVSIPGIGFGSYGNNYLRLSGFCFREDILKAIKRIDKLKK